MVRDYKTTLSSYRREIAEGAIRICIALVMLVNAFTPRPVAASTPPAVQRAAAANIVDKGI